MQLQLHLPRRLSLLWALPCCVLWACAAAPGAAPVPAAPPAATLTLYSAGSLRGALTELTRRHAERTGVVAQVSYGPSGKLRERIEAGSVPDIFLSASQEHVERLQAQGVLRNSRVFAHNAMCLLLRPGLAPSAQGPVAMLLDPALVLATSTPRADPAGDYTWEVFRRIDAQRPGSYAVLDAKARQLLGAELPPSAPTAPAAPASPYAQLLGSGKADIIVSYCTAVPDAQRALPGLLGIDLPPAVNVSTAAALGAARTADAAAAARADAFIAYVLSDEGQAVLARFGFR
jgi:ABC-type molybdate transport system substrate-binding protein